MQSFLGLILSGSCSVCTALFFGLFVFAEFPELFNLVWGEAGGSLVEMSVPVSMSCQMYLTLAQSTRKRRGSSLPRRARNALQANSCSFLACCFWALTKQIVLPLRNRTSTSDGRADYFQREQVTPTSSPKSRIFSSASRTEYQKDCHFGTGTN